MSSAIDTDQGVVKTTDCGVKAWGCTRMGADCFFHGTFLPFPRVLLFGKKCNSEFLLSFLFFVCITSPFHIVPRSPRCQGTLRSTGFDISCERAVAGEEKGGCYGQFYSQGVVSPGTGWGNGAQSPLTRKVPAMDGRPAGLRLSERLGGEETIIIELFKS